DVPAGGFGGESVFFGRAGLQHVVHVVGVGDGGVSVFSGDVSGIGAAGVLYAGAAGVEAVRRHGGITVQFAVDVWGGGVHDGGGWGACDEPALFACLGGRNERDVRVGDEVFRRARDVGVDGAVQRSVAG